MGSGSLDGRVVLVTGGNSGIGLGMAGGLADADAAVCIWGTNPERTHATFRSQVFERDP
jgi:NAD(P)-dependent dehydrogenase (short-subunit alcohol dehydrogenase family)